MFLKALTDSLSDFPRIIFRQSSSAESLTAYSVWHLVFRGSLPILCLPSQFDPLTLCVFPDLTYLPHAYRWWMSPDQSCWGGMADNVDSSRTFARFSSPMRGSWDLEPIWFLGKVTIAEPTFLHLLYQQIVTKALLMCEAHFRQWRTDRREDPWTLGSYSSKTGNWALDLRELDENSKWHWA